MFIHSVITDNVGPHLWPNPVPQQVAGVTTTPSWASEAGGVAEGGEVGDCGRVV